MTRSSELLRILPALGLVACTGCGRTATYLCTQSVSDPGGGACNPATSITSLTLAGRAFLPTSCQSGDAEGESFFGVDLDDGTHTVRLTQAPDGSSSVYELTDAAPDPASALPGCPSFFLRPGVNGNVSLDCGTGDQSLQGSVILTGCSLWGGS